MAIGLNLTVFEADTPVKCKEEGMFFAFSFYLSICIANYK